MNLENLVKNIQKMALPETALRSMYDVVANGNGTARVLRLENGKFYQKDGDEYFEVSDIFTYIFESIPNAPGMMIKAAQKMMDGQRNEAQSAIKSFCANGGTALVFTSPKIGDNSPKINAIVKFACGVRKYDDGQLFEMFKNMMKN